MHWVVALFIGIVSLVGATSCTLNCGFDPSHFGSCRQLNQNVQTVQVGGFGACDGSANSRKVKISCSNNSGSQAACTSRSDGSGFFSVLVPNNANGQFIDSNYSSKLGYGPIRDCQSLWTALNQNVDHRPSDIAAIYRGDPARGDKLVCTDAGGCSAVSTDCYAAWDQNLGGAGTNTASLINGKYLACTFIDSPYLDGSGPQGAPPLMGNPAALVASSPPDQFSGITLKNPRTSPILFDQWRDYQSGTDRCSTTTNSRKISIACDASAGTHAACTSRSDQSGYFVVLVPDSGSGVFNDSSAGLISNCSALWQALNAADGSRPSDVVAYYHGDPASADFVSCSDSNGCSTTSRDCFSSWDSRLQSPGGSAASIRAGNYLMCAFIDSPYTDGSGNLGSPPAVGLPGGLVANSASTSFAPITIPSGASGIINLNSWVDY